MRIKRSSISLVAFLLLLSCSQKKELEPREYLEFINTHGNPILSSAKSLNGASYTVQYLPIEYMVLSNGFLPDIEIDKKKLSEEMDSQKGTLFFRMVIKDEASAVKVRRLVLEKEKYVSVLEYSNNELISDIKLMIGNNTYSCVLCHLEPPSSIKPELRVAFEFDVPATEEQKDQDYTITFDDGLLDNGLIKFRFARQELNKLPKLKLI